MNEPTCKNCQNYIQHYSAKGGKFAEVYCGHCRKAHLKRKRPDASICEHFLPGSGEADIPVTKDYLARKTLEYFLSMGLLSDLLDAGAAMSEKEISKYRK